MLTRSAKRKSMHSECDPLVLQVPGNKIHIQTQTSISIESSGCVPLGNEQLQRPIFNVHIYSPVYEIRAVKISMPETDSLIQVCPNKVLENLELNTGNKSGKLTPVLGNMELSSDSNSVKRNCLEVENNTSSQKCLNDIKKDSSKSSKDRCSSRKGTGSKNDNNKTFKNTKETSSCSVDINSIKLNKAVVVLTDISKSKYYKEKFGDQTPKDQVDINGNGTKKDFSRIKVKQENLNSNTGITDNCCTVATGSTFETRPSIESVPSTSLSGSRLLTQLAEGCSFSEILNRFRLKNGNCLVDTLKRADTVHHESFNREHFSHHDSLVLKSERVSFSEDEATMEGFLTSEIAERIESMDFEDSKLLDLPQGSEYEKSRDAEHLRDWSLDSCMVSDHSKNSTAVHSLSEDVTAAKEIPDSSSLTTNVVSNRYNLTVPEEISSMSETSDNQISITNNSNLNLHESEQPNLEMDKEIMKGKKFLRNNKSKSKKKKESKTTFTKPPHSFSSPKKMKQSNQKSETSHSKPKLPDEYVPLQVSGPTKFGVAMLNEIKPYVQHDAKDFKNKMLFGDRNRRVSSSQHLQIYKLKQRVNRSIRG